MFIALAGTLPHALFSIETGESSAFKSAYDEDIYADLAVNGPLLPHRALSSLAFKALYLAGGSGMESPLVLSDIVFPVLCAIPAAWVACLLARRAVSRAALLFLFLFGQEALSFGCSAFGTGAVETLRVQLPHALRALIPHYQTSFFSLFRTPDPQASWAVMWAFLALLAGWLKEPPERRQRYRAASLLLLSLIFPFCYIFIGLPLLVLELASGVLLWLAGRRGIGAAMALCGAVGVAVATAVHVTSTASAERASLAFASRAPSLTVSVVLSVLSLAACTLKCLRQPSDIRAVALPFVAAPAVLMNQQVLTGFMVAGGNWERYFNYPSLIFGLALFFCAPKASAEPEGRKWRVATAVAVLLLPAAILVGQLRVHRGWQGSNRRSVAMARALASIPAENLPGLTVAVDPPELAPLVALRTQFRLPMLLSYADTVRHRIANIGPTDPIPKGRGLHQSRLFEFFARTGRTASAVRAILEAEAEGRSTYYLAFLFSFRDFWPPASQGQAVKGEVLRSQIPEIVREYRAQLTCPPAEWARPSVVVAAGSPIGPEADDLWVSTRAGSAGSGEYVETAFLQSPSRTTRWQCSVVRDSGEPR